MLHNDLYSWMIGTPGVSSLFPGGIHHLSLPQDVETWPALTFQLITRIETAPDMNSPNDAKLDTVTYQFDVYSDASASGITAAESFLGIFRNFRGTMTTTEIQMVELSNVSQLEERRGDKLRRRVSMDFSITFEV
jgi:hypothetical protein